VKTPLFCLATTPPPPGTSPGPPLNPLFSFFQIRTLSNGVCRFRPTESTTFFSSGCQLCRSRRPSSSPFVPFGAFLVPLVIPSQRRFLPGHVPQGDLFLFSPHAGRLGFVEDPWRRFLALFLGVSPACASKAFRICQTCGFGSGRRGNVWYFQLA